MKREDYENYGVINLYNLAQEVAEIMTKNASESELRVLYYDDRYNYLREVPIEELLEIKEDM